jgi:Methyltransferase domain
MFDENRSTEMAREFPHCEVLGIDLAPVPLPPESLPPNCQFEIDDISLGLSHLEAQFDVVFARAIGLGLKDFRKALADMERCAKPGGIVIWIDGDDFYSGFRIIYRPFWTSKNPNGSYSQRVLYGKSSLGGYLVNDANLKLCRASKGSRRPRTE